VGKIDLGPGVIQSIRTTPDGKRVIVVVNTSNTSVIDVIDTRRPEAPHLDGHVDIETGAFDVDQALVQAALSPDGRRVLLATTSRAIGPDKAVMTFLDTADSKNPAVLWKREIQTLGAQVALSNDASAYAATVRVDDSKGGADFRTLITSVAEPGRSIALDHLGPGALSLSDEAGFLAHYDGYSLTAIDIRETNPVSYVSAPASGAKHACDAARDDGLIVASEGSTTGRVELLGMGSSQLSPVSAFRSPLGNSAICVALNRNDSGRDIIFSDNGGMIVRMDLRDPRHPAKDGYWRARGSFTSAVAAGMLFDEAGPSVLQISKLEWADRAPVDWRKLDAVYTQAMQRPVGVERGSTIDAFETAGIFNAISARITGVTRQRAALILRYYSTLVGGGGTQSSTIQSEVAKAALRRSRKLDPTARAQGVASPS